MSPNQSAGLMKQTTWKEMFQLLVTVMIMMCIGHLQMTISSCPLFHRLLVNPILTGDIFPNHHPAFLGNLSYDVTKDSIKEFFRRSNISAVHSVGESSNPERLKGFDYVEFEGVDFLFNALSFSEVSLGNRI